MIIRFHAIGDICFIGANVRSMCSINILISDVYVSVIGLYVSKPMQTLNINIISLSDYNENTSK